MTDMRKVRVSLVDADGKTHEVVGYRRNDEQPVVFMEVDSEAGINKSACIAWIGDSDVTVTPIVELPTGLGAVVEVLYGPPTNDSDQYVHVGHGKWVPQHRLLEPVSGKWFKERRFTVLSEGVK
jgi:hypothetical protein